MGHAGVLLVAVAAVALSVVALAAAHWYRRAHEVMEPEPETPASLVRVLQTDEELRVAVRRAVAFEQRVADELRTRTRRYEALITPAPVSGIRVHRPASPTADPAARPRSA
jgi:hypothetical protein